MKTGERAVKGNRKAFMALQYYFLNERSHVAKCDSVFVSMGKSKSNTGQPLKAGSIQSLFRKLRLKTNINHFHAHILRHTFATNFLSLCRDDGSKVGITMLKNLMGHKNLSTTMKYLHLRYLVDDADIGKPFEEYMDKILDI